MRARCCRLKGTGLGGATRGGVAVNFWGVGREAFPPPSRGCLSGFTQPIPPRWEAALGGDPIFPWGVPAPCVLAVGRRGRVPEGAGGQRGASRSGHGGERQEPRLRPLRCQNRDRRGAESGVEGAVHRREGGQGRPAAACTCKGSLFPWKSQVAGRRKQPL